jgi:protein O-GlcNAc transferase
MPMPPAPADVHAPALRDALKHHQASRMAEAESGYRRILAASPDHPDALHLLGVLEQQRGKLDEAVALFERAIRGKPRAAAFHRNLGTALFSLGKTAEAEKHHRLALSLNPDFPEAHHSLAEALRTRQQFVEAEAHYRKALALRPSFAFAQNGLGLCLAAQGRFAEAEAAYRASLSADGKFHQASVNLARALELQRRPKEAEEEYKRALAIDPVSLAANVNLGNLLKEEGRTTDAQAAYKVALRHHPNNPAAHNNIANLYKDQGLVAKALEHFRHAISLDPRFGAAHHNVLLTLHYIPGPTPEEIFAAHRDWGLRQVMKTAPHTNTRDPERRLRIGYLSPDFRRHPVASFIEPVIAAHNRGQVEVFCYAAQLTPDRVTERIKTLPDHWREIGAMDPESAAALIRKDQIDVLVELAGHTANNRLFLCARKPAPVQASYLGYPDTTGLPAMDFRITDAVADPAGAERFAVERLVRLPGCHLCFRPSDEAPEVGSPPLRREGRVTFGSFNMLAKMNPPLLARWAKILAAVPDSRLVLKAAPFKDESTRRHFHAIFQGNGIAPERVELRRHLPKAGDHFALYNEIDVALDTDPYNGVTTTCEALWMGVPVVTRRGQIHVSRVASSLLTAIGMTDTIVESEDEYVARAVALAAAPDKLEEMRKSLRPRMAASPLVDAKAFTQKLEAGYRAIWRDYCART